MAATRPALSRWRADRLFFTGAALFAAVIVFAGFARSYYLSHWLTPPARTPEITPLLHMHALVFTLWTCLIVVQPLLIAKGAIGIHRRLGIAGEGLAALVWIFGNLAAPEAIEAGDKGMGDHYHLYAITFLSYQPYWVIPSSSYS